MTPMRILLIDDHAMFRTGLRMVFAEGMPAAEFLEAHSLEDALEIKQLGMDLILLDIILKGPKGQSGLDGIAPLKLKWPRAHILVLSSQDDQETARKSIGMGATAFVSKSETAEKIINLARRVLEGPSQAIALAADYMMQRRLTPRQVEVLKLLHKGLSNKLIAQQLALSDNTVRRHVQDILEFFEVVSRAEAVFAARSQGLVD